MPTSASVSASASPQAGIPQIWTMIDRKPLTLAAPLLDHATVTALLTTSLPTPPPKAILRTTSISSRASSTNTKSTTYSDCTLVAEIELKPSPTGDEDDKCDRCSGYHKYNAAAVGQLRDLIHETSKDHGASIFENTASPLDHCDNAIDTSQPFIDRWPAETCMVLEPCYTIAHRAPLKPDFPDWDKIWQSMPIEILRSDVHIRSERRYEGARWLVILKPGRVLQNFHQGSVINFIEDDTEVKYVVTWKRARTRTHTLIEVVAFTADRRVIEPYAVAWPSLVMLVPHIQNKAPTSPELRQYGHQLNREQQEMELELADEAWKDAV